MRYHSDKLDSEIHDKVRELLIQADLEQDRYTMPVDLSVGMRKLLGLARALACDPALLVIDDPWNGVDSITVNRICRLLLDLKRRRGTTLLIAANKVPDVQRICDQLAILDGGHLITCGPPDELARCGNPVASEFALSQDVSMRAFHTVGTRAFLIGGLILFCAGLFFIRAVMFDARHTAQDVREIVTHVKQGQGTIGKLVADRKLADSIDQIVADARQSALELKSISARMNDTIADFQRRDLLGRSQALLENARQVTEQLKQVAAALASSPSVEDGSAGNLRDTLASARTTMANLVADSEALERNFFLRGFFKRKGYYTLDQMTPAEYRSSNFLRGNSSERIWLSNDELFSSGSGDREELTKEGQRQIDDAMGALVPYLPNSPMVVEGYATQGSPSERFIRAQERATVVKTYIRKRFGLHPHMVGVMPMSDPAPPSVGKSAWDGVSLVLIR